MRITAAASLLALLFAGACATVETKPKTLAITGGYTHAPSRYAFPTEVGGARRVTLFQRGDEGKRLTAGYGTGSPECPVAITLWLDPAPIGQSKESMEEAFERAKAAEQEAHPEAGLILTDAKETPPIGRRAIYLSPESGTTTDLVIWLIEDGWFVTYRAIQPERCIDDARKAGTAFYQGWAALRGK
jgi:hypothetical protein